MKAPWRDAVQLMRLHFAIPGDIETRTGGYIYDRRVLALLPALGIDAVHLPLPSGFPFPTQEDIARTAQLVGAIPAQDVILADGLAWGAVPPELAASIAAPVVALCHHPLGLETGLSNAQSRHLLRNEQAVLASAAHVIVSSATTGETLQQEFQVEASRITVAEPGTDRRPRATGQGAPPHIIAVGSVAPRKAYDMLIAALALIKDRPWRCTIAGSLQRAPEFADRVASLIREHGLGGRVTLAGEIEDAALERLYLSADVFVSSSHYEGYGMVLAEALAHGLPIVATTGGAASATVPDAAALKTPVNDAAAFSRAMATLLDNPQLRHEIAAASWKSGLALPTWEDTARRIAQAVQAAARGQGDRP